MCCPQAYAGFRPVTRQEVAAVTGKGKGEAGALCRACQEQLGQVLANFQRHCRMEGSVAKLTRSGKGDSSGSGKAKHGNGKGGSGGSQVATASPVELSVHLWGGDALQLCLGGELGEGEDKRFHSIVSAQRVDRWWTVAVSSASFSLFCP